MPPLIELKTFELVQSESEKMLSSLHSEIKRLENIINGTFNSTLDNQLVQVLYPQFTEIEAKIAQIANKLAIPTDSNDISTVLDLVIAKIETKTEKLPLAKKFKKISPELNEIKTRILEEAQRVEKPPSRFDNLLATFTKPIPPIQKALFKKQ